MPPELHWPAIALRLVLSLCAGAVLGADRSRNGHPAGLRTVILVTLAAAVAMIQMDLLLPTGGKSSSSFAVMDVMRLPLGILTGVGFIGAGAIVRKGDMVLGVTTAATLWFATVVGLCLGAGQIILGAVSAAPGYGVLTALHWLERRIEQYQAATLILVIEQDALAPADLRERLRAARFRIKTISVDRLVSEHRQRFRCEVRWPSRDRAADVPPVLAELERIPGLIRLAWRPAGTGAGG